MPGENQSVAGYGVDLYDSTLTAPLWFESINDEDIQEVGGI